MKPHLGKVVLNGAPTQYARLLAAAAADGARVDGRTPEELRAFAVRVAALFVFYDLDDEPDGDWKAFFLSDPGMVEAALGSAHARALAARLRGARATAADGAGDGAGEMRRSRIAPGKAARAGLLARLALSSRTPTIFVAGQSADAVRRLTRRLPMTDILVVHALSSAVLGLDAAG